MLGQFTHELTQHVDYVMKSACGEGDPWATALGKLGLPQGMASAVSPAPEAEVRTALEAIRQRATTYLDQLCSSEPGLDQVQVEGVRKRLAVLVDHEAQRYAGAVAESKSAAPASLGVASIFQNAVQSAQLSPWAHLEYNLKVTITCRVCGAPQQAQAVFNCEFCGSDVFDRLDGGE